MSDETTLNFKLATLASIAIGILTIGMVVVGIWITSISTAQSDIAKTQSVHGEDIAVLKQSNIIQKDAQVYIINRIDEIRADQIRRLPLTAGEIAKKMRDISVANDFEKRKRGY